jgi:hypothetical protein
MWYVVETTAGEKIVVPMGVRVRLGPEGALIVCMDGGDSRAGWAPGEWASFRRQSDVDGPAGPTEGVGAPLAESSAPTTTSTDGAEDSPGEVPF